MSDSMVNNPPSRPPHRALRQRSRAPDSLGGLALTLVALLGGCGKDEPPAPVPAGATGAKADAAGAQADATPAKQAPEPGPRKAFAIPVSVTAAPAGTPADAPATLRGVARLLGGVPERKPITMDYITDCKHHPEVLSEKVIATATGELANVIVYVVRGLEDTAPPEEPVELLQEGCMFKPHVVVVHTGQTLSIRNADEANHNLNAKPAHGSNPAFNKMQPPGSKDLEVVFPRAEIAIPIGCDVHPWMKAHIAVVAHDGWAVSDETGAWSIEVPPGEYLVEGWHAQFGTQKGEVVVGPGEVADLDFSFQSKKKAP